MSTLELREKIKKNIDRVSDTTLAQILLLVDEDAIQSAAYKKYRSRMPTDIVQAVLESEEDIRMGRVMTLDEAKKRFEEWKMKKRRKKTRK